MIVDENSNIPFMAKDYIRAQDAIQETVKCWKSKGPCESQIAKFLADNQSIDGIGLKGIQSIASIDELFFIARKFRITSLLFECF